MSQRSHDLRTRFYGREPHRSRASERREMRFCPQRPNVLHPISDRFGYECEPCRVARAAALARCEVLHPTAPTYADGRGVLRFDCCYRRVDGQPEE